MIIWLSVFYEFHNVLKLFDFKQALSRDDEMAKLGKKVWQAKVFKGISFGRKKKNRDSAMKESTTNLGFYHGLKELLKT